MRGFLFVNETMQQALHRLDAQLVMAGFRQLLPLSFFVMVFGLAFGLAAAQQGLSSSSIIWMSATVFAGASQFAALELWGERLSLLPLLITVFAINARHLLMGATLYPWLKELPPKQRYGVMALASDANWALSLQAFSCNRPGFGVLLGGGIALWIFWVLGSWLGIYFGHAIAQPQQFGLDIVLACFLLAMVVGGEKNLRSLGIWTVAATSSLLAWRFLPDNSHVIVGALAGGLAGVWLGPKQHES